jgi:hypothetical protein
MDARDPPETAGRRKTRSFIVRDLSLFVIRVRYRNAENRNATLID